MVSDWGIEDSDWEDRKFDHLPITIKKFIKDQEKAEKERKI